MSKKKLKKYEIGGSVGALVGQALIPIPGVGAGIGQLAGELGESLINRKKLQREANTLREQEAFANRALPDSGQRQFADGGSIAKRAIRKGKSVVRYTSPLLRKLEGGVQNVVSMASAGRGTPQIDVGLPKHRTQSEIAARKNRQRVKGGSPVRGGQAGMLPKFNATRTSGAFNATREQIAKNQTFNATSSQVVKDIPDDQAGVGRFNATRSQNVKDKLRATRSQVVKDKPKYAYGGKILATGGSLTKIGNGAVKVKGKKHAQGGVKLNRNVEVEGGETIANVQGTPFVFSDRVKVPGQKQSFADLHESAERRGVGERAVADIAAAQENTKAQQGVGQKFRSEKYGYGGFDKMKPMGVQANAMPKGLTANLPNAAPAMGAAGVTSGSGFGDFMTKNANLINPLINIGAGLLKVNKAGKAPNIERSALNDLKKMPTKFNIEPQLAEARQGLRTIASNSAATPNTLLAAHSQNLQNRSRLLGEKENKENQLKSAKIGAMADVNQRSDIYDNRTAAGNEQEKTRARSANSNLLIGGLGQLGGAAQQAKMDKMMTEAQPFELAAILAGSDAKSRTRLLELLSQGAPERFKAVLDAMQDQK